jgi:hypothetical protein
LGRAAGFLAASAILPLAYAVGQDRTNGHFVLGSPVGNWNLYGRVAPFADCGSFTPPKGTRVLCERKPPDKRPGPNEYIFNVALSPGLQHFSDRSSPRPSKEIARFTRAVIVHQPLGYAKEVARDMKRYVASKPRRQGDGQDWEAFTDQLVNGADPGFAGRPFSAPTDFRPFYRGHGLFKRDGAVRKLRSWERATRIQGPLLVILVLLMLVGPVLLAGKARFGALLVTLMTLVLLIGPVATVVWDARYAMPALPLLGCGAGLGAWAIATRVARA